MADNVIGILFGVAGGKDINGKSGALIKSQLEALANKINLKINVDRPHFTKQLNALKQELDNKLGNIQVNVNTAGTRKSTTSPGGGRNETADQKQSQVYAELKKQLEDVYVLYKKLDSTRNTSSERHIKLSTQTKRLRDEYVNSVQSATSSKSISDEQSQLLQSRQIYLKKVRQAQEDLNSATDKDKMSGSMQTSFDGLIAKVNSLKERYADLIAHNKEAAVAMANLQAIADKPFSGVDGLDKSGQKIASNMTEASNQIRDLSQALKQASSSMSDLQVKTDTVGTKLRKAFESKLFNALAYTLLGITVRAFKQVYDNVVALDKAITNLQIATGKTRNETAELVESYVVLAKQLGATVIQVTESADTWLRQGYSIAETNKLIQYSMMLSKLGQLESAEAAKALTSTMKGYKVSVEDSIRIVDKFTAVDMQAAVSAGDIATAMAETAASADITGVSMDKLIGYIATVAEVTQDGAESVGTFYKTLFARMGSVKAGTFIDAETGESLNDVEKVLQSLGVSLRSETGEFRNFGDVLDEVGGKWNIYNGVQQHALATAFSGTRQQEKFLVLMENYGDALNYATTAANSAGTAETKYSDAILNGIDAKVNTLKATWEGFSMNLLDSDIIKFLLDLLSAIGSILNAFISLGDGALPKIAIIVAAVYGLMKVTKALNPVIKKLISSLKTAIITQGSFGAAAQGALLKIRASLKNFMAENAPMLMISAIITAMTLFEGKAQGFAEIVVGAAAFIALRITLAAKVVDGTIKSFMASNSIGWIILAITALVAVIKGIVDLVKSYNPSYEDLKKAAQESIDAWKDVEEELENVRSKIEDIEDELEKLRAIETPTLTDEADIARLEQQLEILKQQEALKEEQAAKAKREAINASETALDKYFDNNKTNNFNRILKNYYGSASADKNSVIDALQQYTELLGEFEYGTNSKLDSYFDDYYEMLDKYTMATDSAASAWKSILSRVKYEDAVDSLQSFSSTFKDTSKITGDALKKLASQDTDIKEFFDYLSTVGLWDGKNWESLTTLIAGMRKPLTELVAVSLADDIEELTEKFESLNDAISDVAKNGIVSLDSLQTLMSKYPELLSKYFSKTLDGYKLSENYKDFSSFDIMKDVAVNSLKGYQDALENAKKALAELSENDDDYEIALKNLAIAQDNLNNKEIEWASLLRELSLEKETEKLESLKDALDEQLDGYKNLIDIRKDLLKTYKDEVQYQKELAAKQKTVADLQTQLSLSKLDKSASGQARTRELETKLQEAQDALDDYTLERAVNDITRELDNGYTEYEKLIKEQTEKIESQISGIASQLDGILSGIEGLSNTQFSGTEMYELYQDIKKKQSNGMAIDSNTQAFMDAVGSGNYNAADKLYSSAKTAADSYKMPTAPVPPKSANEKIAEEMTKIKGAWGQGIASNNEGDNGEVVLNGTTYHIESAGDDSSLYKAAYDINKFGDRDIFHYKGNLYGCLDGSIIKLREQDGWGKFGGGVGNNNGWEALKRATGIYHTGGFVGDVTTLKSNEEFAKLLKGEFVSTPEQIDRFINNTLPAIATNGNRILGSTINNNSPLIEIQCGNIDKNTFPQFKGLVDEAVEKITKNMASALSRTGHRKKI